MTLYITSLSFEDRCLALTQALGEDEGQCGMVALDFAGYESVDPYLINRAALIRRMAGLAIPLEVVGVELGSPLQGERALGKVVGEMAPRNVVLDVSTLPRSYLFGICRMLCDLEIETTVRYYKPRTYGGQLSRGVGRVQTVPGFEGARGLPGDSVLVVILGFEGYKALYAWEELGGGETILLVGDPPYRPSFLKTARRNNEELIRRVSERGRVEGLHTFDIPKAYGQLTRIYEELRGRRGTVEMTVCPLGTKPQSVAAFALAYRRPEVAIACVSSLMYYTGDYSRGYQAEYVEISLQELVA